jgi:hypothetical protein
MDYPPTAPFINDKYLYPFMVIRITLLDLIIDLIIYEFQKTK